jgi:putative spermidine/putrescine transport system permease protein
MEAMRESGSRRGRSLGLIGPTAMVVLAAAFFVSPLLAMARFSFQGIPMIRLGWSTLFDRWSFDGITTAVRNQEFRSALRLSLALAVGTVAVTLAVMLPTTLWLHLRIPRARPIIEFLTLLPYVIPPIALVAGVVPLKPHARWFLNSDYALIPFYVVLALPFTFRALDTGIAAIDVRTLVDASRSLGAGWGTTTMRVLVPNLRASIISVSFLTGAVVLGEYTMARVLLKPTVPSFMTQYQSREPQGGMALAFTALIATASIFAVLSLLTRPRGARSSSSEVRGGWT